MREKDFIINPDDLILVTGAKGFIGLKVVQALISYGFTKLRCFVRTSTNMNLLNKIIDINKNIDIEIIKGDLISMHDCEKATDNVSVIYHLAASFGKSNSSAYKNAVIPTKNLLDSILKNKKFKRFLHVSSFAVYSNKNLKGNEILDEKCDIEKEPERSGEAYCYGKIKQEDLILEYAKKYNIPFVIVRPGAVYGPGSSEISLRVGFWCSGIFFHLGGSNIIPFTYIDNCADAIVLAGIKDEVNGEIFNIVDDDPPTSRDFLKLYKQNIGNFPSIFIPYSLMYFNCLLWELGSKLSNGRIRPVLNRRRCRTYWKGNLYTNEKLKKLLGWKPNIRLEEGLKHFFEFCKQEKGEL